MSETGEVDMQMVDSQIWIPAEEPVSNKTFLLNSKIWDICQDLPIHWTHPSPLRGYKGLHLLEIQFNPSNKVSE